MTIIKTDSLENRSDYFHAITIANIYNSFDNYRAKEEKKLLDKPVVPYELGNFKTIPNNQTDIIRTSNDTVKVFLTLSRSSNSI